MAYNSKYTGQEVENLLDQVAEGGGTQVQADWQESDTSSPSFIKNKPNIWQGYQDGQPIGPIVFESSISIPSFSFPTPFDVQAGNILFDQSGIHYSVLEFLGGDPKEMNIIHTGDGTKFLADDGTYKEVSGGGGGITTESDPIFSASPAFNITDKDITEWNNKQPMVCAYTIGSYTARTIALENHTYNGQTMDYREGAIISVLNPNSTDIVFVGGIVTLDGNEYEADAFTLKSGATALFSLGPDPGVLLPISSVGGATTAYVDQAIANAITNTLNTPV